MAVRSAKKIQKALLKKGFRKDDGRDHVYLWFWQGETRTAIYTKISHGGGNRDVGSALLAKMARQCKLRKEGFLRLVDCPLTKRGYQDHLQQQGFLEGGRRSSRGPSDPVG